MPVPKKNVIEFPSVLDSAYKESKRHKKVSDIMSRKIITTTPETPMVQAAKTMGEKHIGSFYRHKIRNTCCYCDGAGPAHQGSCMQSGH